MIFIILDFVINVITSICWRRSFVFSMMQIKIINNWTKEIIKNFCNSFVFSKSSHHFHSKQHQYQPCCISYKNMVCNLSKTVCYQQSYKNEIFKFSMFIQVSNLITLLFKIANIALKEVVFLAVTFLYSLSVLNVHLTAIVFLTGSIWVWTDKFRFRPLNWVSVARFWLRPPA